MSRPQTLSSNCSRLKTRPGCSRKNSSRRDSVGPRSIGRPLLQPRVGLVAAGDGLDLISFGIEVVTQKRGQRFLVFHHQNACAHESIISYIVPDTRLSFEHDLVPKTGTNFALTRPFGS